MRELRVLALTGNLGYGYGMESLRNGVEARPDMIGADNGSTDAGPYYLGSGHQLTKPAQVRPDLRPALIEARRLGVPLIIGSAGTAGGEPHLQSLLSILSDVAREEGLHFRAAAIHAEIPGSLVRRALAEGRISSMPGTSPLTATAIDASARIVGQMGIRPFVQAMAGGADVVVAGRSCDTAIYAAIPSQRRFDLGLAYHMAKIMECGAQCAIPLAANDCLLGTLRDDHFLVQPLDPKRTVTPESVAAHAMYEQGNPFEIVEPDGKVDLSEAQYEQVDARTVRVSGSQWIPRTGYTVKLEGAVHGGYATVCVAGARDPAIIENLDLIEAEACRMAKSNLNGVLDDDCYTMRVRAYLHCSFPGRKTTSGNLAFPYSPSDFRVGPVFEFSIYHLLHTDRPDDLFPVEFIEF